MLTLTICQVGFCCTATLVKACPTCEALPCGKVVSCALHRWVSLCCDNKNVQSLRWLKVVDPVLHMLVVRSGHRQQAGQA